MALAFVPTESVEVTKGTAKDYPDFIKFRTDTSAGIVALRSSSNARKFSDLAVPGGRRRAGPALPGKHDAVAETTP